ncbi:MAG: TIGR03936 family radical SAM-associated protein [Lachnospiraceae bacterium]|nr:TIGR03936 family radical SAM-associated protein [Lachnospiraceae bacterium]
MKVRIKFAKSGVMVYIGHLDLLRYFQKSMRRAQIDIKYSEGFSPHQIMSFAAPLGVGVISNGEYMDVELNSSEGKASFIDSLNEVMVPGVKILNAVLLPDKAKNAMSSVAAASYRIVRKDGGKIPEEVISSADVFIGQNEIMITKETKKNVMELDIKPHIYQFGIDSEEISLKVDASSAGNIKPMLVVEALYRYAGVDFDPLDMQIIRDEMYMDIGEGDERELVSLDSIGEDF